MLFSGELGQFISAYGYWVVAVLVGLESIGLPVPGETTLWLAAIYAGAGHHLDIALVIAAAAGGAIVGDNIGYLIGRELGYRVARRWGHSVGLTERRLKLGQFLFHRNGGKIVFLGRFLPLLRFLAAFLAGVNRMRWGRFLVFNATGSVFWAASVGTAVYYLGAVMNQFAEPIEILLAVVMGGLMVAEFLYVKRHEAELEQEIARSMRASPQSGYRGALTQT